MSDQKQQITSLNLFLSFPWSIKIAKYLYMKDILLKAKKIKLLVFDVDGVLTDGSLIVGDDGQEYKAFYSKDGLGMKMLLQTGVKIAVITARTSNVVIHRMQSLGVNVEW